MNENPKNTHDPAQLAASLTPLGIREITERMEVSPLLVDQGDFTPDQSATICCTCKIPWEEGQLPYPVVEPPMGSGSGMFVPPLWP
jgi:hypothetical protein